ncbi:MAG: hypothetical protein K6C99_11365 [Lachnospiraceae bacterium]|nr:hypothetical protein [Lachnospiraceae bacterium]
MTEKIEFDTEVTPHMLKEIDARRRNSILLLIIIIVPLCELIALFVTGRLEDHYMPMILVDTAVVVGIFFVIESLRKKRGGNSVKYHVVFDDRGIHILNKNRKRTSDIEAESVNRYYETKSLMVLVCGKEKGKPGRMLAMERAKDPDGLVRKYLAEKCPQCKPG